MNAWTVALAEYVTAMSRLRDPLTTQQVDEVKDALVRLTTAHYALLAHGAERAVREAKQ